MKNKFLLFLLVSLFSIPVVAQEVTAIWNPSANPNTTFLWTEDANWEMAEAYPNDIEGANPEIGTNDFPATAECILDDSVNVFNIKVGHGGEEEAVLRIVKGGYLNTGKWWSGIAWTSPGRLIVERGGGMTFGEHMWVGWKSDGVAIIEGVVNVTAMYGGGIFGGHDGVSNTFVKNGGVLNLSQLHDEKSFSDGSFIDIAGGVLNFKATAENYEEVIARLTAFIDNEQIISYEGNGELTLTWVEEEGVVRVTAASVVYQVNLSEVTDMKDGGKVWVMLGDGSDYEEMTDDNGDGIYVASVTADRAEGLTYWFEYENGSDRTIEDLTGKDCASSGKRAISGVPVDSVMVLPAFLFNSCDEAEEAVQQATTEWTGAASNLWKVAENWSDGFVPADNKVVFKNPEAPESILNVESTIKTFVLGDGGEAKALKVVEGGTLTTTEGWSGIGWSAPASMIVEDGGTVNFGGHAWIGWESDASLMIDGGTVNVAGMYGTAFEGGAGTAMVTVKRGALNLAQLHDTKSIPEGSKLDISAGTVTILGDKSAAVNAYIDAGRITGYDGKGTVTVTVSNDTTVLMATPARQEVTVWNPAANPNTTGLWSEAPNWSDSNVPLDNKVVFKTEGALECVLDVESTIKTFVMGDNGPGGTLRVTDGGTLTTTAGWSGVAWSHDATLIVEAGGTINFAEHAWIGWDADATLQINGGIVNVGGMFGTAFEGQSGKGFTTVNDGELNLTGFHPEKSIPDSSFINIKLGKITIPGDQTAVVDAYVADGKIKAYDGNGTVNVAFADDVTTITATAVRGSTTVWNPEANPMTTGLWSEALNWTDGLVPDGNKVVTNVPGARELVLKSEASVEKFVFGDGGDGGVVRIADGGNLTTTSGWSGIGWSDTATVIVEKGGEINFAEHAWIGWDGNATLIINGGVVNVAGMYGTAFEGGAGSAMVKVKRGALNLSNIHPDKSIPDGSVLDLELGVVRITGDHVEKVNAYKDAGKITAFGGTGTLEVTLVEGVTVILALPEAGSTTVWDPESNPGTSDGLWSNYLNWSDRHVPADNKVVFKNPDAVTCVMDVESTIKKFVLGDGNEGGTLHIVNGGSLTTTDGWSGVAWTHPAKVVIDTGGVVNFASHAWIGWVGDAVVEINGGTMNVGGMYGTAFDGQPGSGKMYVNSGELNLSGFHPEKSIPDGSVIDIKAGKVTIQGDQLAVVQTYIDAGKITAYGGSGQLFKGINEEGNTWIEAKDWTVSAKDIADDAFTTRVYPNPSKGRISIENPSNGSFTYSIFSITGRMMLAGTETNDNLVDVDLSNFERGLYFVKVQAEGKSITKKVILQ